MKTTDDGISTALQAVTAREALEALGGESSKPKKPVRAGKGGNRPCGCGPMGRHARACALKAKPAAARKAAEDDEDGAPAAKPSDRQKRLAQRPDARADLVCQIHAKADKERKAGPCGARVKGATASQHAWAAHKKAVPADEIGKHFAAVSS
jgi:hypothetical protein